MTFVTEPPSTSKRRTVAVEQLAAFTVDVEQDCPPYLNSHRGMTEGMPALLDLLSALRVRATFFTTGEMARLFPRIVERVVADGHELACHGNWHRDFTRLSREEADRELDESTATLRRFGPVVSFRAPYLRFPTANLDLLPKHGLTIDSSVARYKRGENHRLDRSVPGLTRIAASMTSSALRLPRMVRNAWIGRLRAPRVLFVHPWEAADFRQSSLRWDCRFRTGERALAAWRDAILTMQCAGAIFVPLRELPASVD
jgi:peptidoglycan/xylan/chitin deacetylase (PgdA/CDA1 family)